MNPRVRDSALRYAFKEMYAGRTGFVPWVRDFSSRTAKDDRTTGHPRNQLRVGAPITLAAA